MFSYFTIVYPLRKGNNFNGAFLPNIYTNLTVFTKSTILPGKGRTRIFDEY